MFIAEFNKRTMWFKDFYFKKRRFIFFYCLIWILGGLFIGQRQAERSLLDTFIWIVTAMIVDAPAIFIMILYVFPKYFNPGKVLQFILAVAVLNIATVFVYYGIYEIAGIGKFKFPHSIPDLEEKLFRVQFHVWKEGVYTIFILSLIHI